MKPIKLTRFLSEKNINIDNLIVIDSGFKGKYINIIVNNDIDTWFSLKLQEIVNKIYKRDGKE